MKANTTLATLDLRSVSCNATNATPKNEMTPAKTKGNGIRAEGARELSEALKVNTTLKTLHLESVQQQDEARQ